MKDLTTPTKSKKIDDFTEEELSQAFKWWSLKIGSYAVDRSLKDVFQLNTMVLSGWLKIAREALLLSIDQAAHSAHVSKATYAEFEKREKDGSITIQSLRKTAEALDCELVYFIRPKNKKPFAQKSWDQIFPLIQKETHINWPLGPRRSLALANRMARFYKNPRIRKPLGLKVKKLELF